MVTCNGGTLVFEQKSTRLAWPLPWNLSASAVERGGHVFNPCGLLIVLGVSVSQMFFTMIPLSLTSAHLCAACHGSFKNQATSAVRAPSANSS